MRKNGVKQKWAEGEAVLNGWLHIPSGWTAEMMANSGYDVLTIDMQHGQLDFGTVLDMLRAISTTDVMPFARTTWNEPGAIMALLDAGAYGIICPMVNTREECEAFVGACRYHPDGYRSRGPTRAALYGGDDYVHHANDEIVTMAMVETATALENLEAIATTPGLDAIYVGPGDLSLTLYGMERSGGDLDYPEFIEVLEEIVAACKSAGIAAGIHTGSPTYARRMLDMGFQFVTVMTDTQLMRTKAREVIGIVRGETDTPDDNKSVY